MYVTLGIYALLCVMVGWIGRWSRLGFWGVVLLSLVVTPAISIVLVLFLSDRARSFFTLFNRSKSKERLDDLSQAPSATHAEHTDHIKQERANRGFTDIFKRSKSKKGATDLTEAPLATQSEPLK